MSEHTIEQIGPHVTQEWRHDGKMTIFTVTETDRKTVDAWMDAIYALIEGYKGQSRPLCLYDVSAPNATFTPYVRKKFEDQAASTTDEEAYLAIVFTRSIFFQVVRLFMERTVRRQHPSMHMRIFFDRQEAIEWLESHLDKIILTPTHQPSESE